MNNLDSFRCSCARALLLSHPVADEKISSHILRMCDSHLFWDILQASSRDFWRQCLMLIFIVGIIGRRQPLPHPLHDSHTIRCEERYYRSHYTNGTPKTPSLVFPSRRRGVLELEEIFIWFVCYSFFLGGGYRKAYVRMFCSITGNNGYHMFPR